MGTHQRAVGQRPYYQWILVSVVRFSREKLQKCFQRRLQGLVLTEMHKIDPDTHPETRNQDNTETQVDDEYRSRKPYKPVRAEKDKANN